MLFQLYYQYYLMLALFLLWYVYVWLQSRNTVAWFYLFLHTVLRYFYYKYMSLYIFFTSLNYSLHYNMHPFSMHNLYFNLVPSHWPTETPWDLEEVKKMHRIPCEKQTNIKNLSLWIWSLARMEQFRFQIQSRASQQTWNRLNSLKLCAVYPQSCMEFLTIQGNTAFRHCTDTITSPPKFGPLAQNSFWYCPNLVCHFAFHFLRTEVLELTVIKHLWAYLHLNVRNNFSFINMLVQLLYSRRQGFLTFFCTTGPFESLVKPTDPFSQKCI